MMCVLIKRVKYSGNIGIFFCAMSENNTIGREVKAWRDAFRTT